MTIKYLIRKYLFSLYSVLGSSSMDCGIEFLWYETVNVSTLCAYRDPRQLVPWLHCSRVSGQDLKLESRLSDSTVSKAPSLPVSQTHTPLSTLGFVSWSLSGYFFIPHLCLRRFIDLSPFSLSLPSSLPLFLLLLFTIFFSKMLMCFEGSTSLVFKCPWSVHGNWSHGDMKPSMTFLTEEVGSILWPQWKNILL